MSNMKQAAVSPDAADEIEFGTGGATSRELNGTDRVSEAGHFLFLVNSMNLQDKDGSVTGLKLGLTVLSGTKNQVSCKLDHFVNFVKKDGTPVAETVEKQNARLVRALSLAPDADIAAGKYKAKWSQAKGRMVFGKVIVKDDRAQIDFGQFWRVGDEAALKIPADIAALTAAGYPVDGQTAFSASEASSGSASGEQGDDGIPF